MLSLENVAGEGKVQVGGRAFCRYDSEQPVDVLFCHDHTISALNRAKINLQRCDSGQGGSTQPLERFTSRQIPPRQLKHVARVEKTADLTLNSTTAREQLQRNSIAVALVVHWELVVQPLLLPRARTITTGRSRESVLLEFGDSTYDRSSPGFPNQVDRTLSNNASETINRDSNVLWEVEERDGKYHDCRICSVSTEEALQTKDSRLTLQLALVCYTMSLPHKYSRKFENFHSLFKKEKVAY